MSKPSRRLSRVESSEPERPSRESAPSHPATGGARGPGGTSRAGRREHPRAYVRKSFYERYRSLILGLAVVATVVLVSAFVFTSAAAKSYSCSTLLQPAPAASGGRLGQPVDDLARQHLDVGEKARYTYCPPASGAHYNQAGQGPIRPRYYGPDDPTTPQGWIHNLEHGGIVILYNCKNGCDGAALQELQSLAQNFPDSPVCHIPRGTNVSPVIARFDEMNAKFAALVWDRILFQDTLDTNQILEFYRTEAERNPPELLCTPASPTPAPTSSPEEASPSASPSAEPTPTAS